MVGELLGTDKPSGPMEENFKHPKVPNIQVPLYELEKSASEFETRKMLLFEQGCKGTGFNPISITEGSPTPSDLLSSARAPEADGEAEFDDLNEDFDDFDDYADATLVEVIANFGGTAAEIEGEGSDENQNILQEESEGLFGTMEGGFQADLFKDGTDKMGNEEGMHTEHDQSLKGLGGNAERMEKVAEGTIRLVSTVLSDSIPRANPRTSDCGIINAAMNEGNAKPLESQVEEASLEWPRVDK